MQANSGAWSANHCCGQESSAHSRPSLTQLPATSLVLCAGCGTALGVPVSVLDERREQPEPPPEAWRPDPLLSTFPPERYVMTACQSPGFISEGYDRVQWGIEIFLLNDRVRAVQSCVRKTQHSNLQALSEIACCQSKQHAEACSVKLLWGNARSGSLQHRVPPDLLHLVLTWCNSKGHQQSWICTDLQGAEAVLAAKRSSALDHLILSCVAEHSIRRLWFCPSKHQLFTQNSAACTVL